MRHPLIKQATNDAEEHYGFKQCSKWLVSKRDIIRLKVTGITKLNCRNIDLTTTFQITALKHRNTHPGTLQGICCLASTEKGGW